MSLSRDELGIRMLCAWNNVKREDAPAEWSSHLNEWTRDAWARVAIAAIEYEREEAARLASVTIRKGDA